MFYGVLISSLIFHFVENIDTQLTHETQESGTFIAKYRHICRYQPIYALYPAPPAGFEPPSNECRDQAQPSDLKSDKANNIPVFFCYNHGRKPQ
jgi:hypothetical protein